MKKDIVNETFQKHLKLLHEHLNINEDAWNDYVRPTGNTWDPDRNAGIRQPSSYRTDRTIRDFVKDKGWDDAKIQTYMWYLNNVHSPEGDSTGHKITLDSSKDGIGYKLVAGFDEWLKDYAQKFKEKKEKELEKELGNELENVSDDLKIPMAGLIKTFGTFGWQKYKRKNIKEKISKLASQAANNEEKVKKEIGDKDYDKLIKYLRDAEFAFLKDEYNEKKYTDIMNRTIEKAEKMLGRGFFEQ